MRAREVRDYLKRHGYEGGTQVLLEYLVEHQNDLRRDLIALAKLFDKMIATVAVQTEVLHQTKKFIDQASKPSEDDDAGHLQ